MENSKINKLEQEIDDLTEKLETAKSNLEIIKSNILDLPEYGSPIYILSGNGVIDECTYKGLFKGYCLNGMTAPTSKEAEFKQFKMQLFTKIKQFAEKNNTEKIDWGNTNQYKYYICFKYNANKFITLCVTESICISNQIYFTSNSIAEKAIIAFKNDLIKYYKEVKLYE